MQPTHSHAPSSNALRHAAPNTPIPAGAQRPMADDKGAVQAFVAMGVMTPPDGLSRRPTAYALDPRSFRSAPRALGGAVGWSFSRPADDKSSSMDRRLLSRMCQIAHQEKTPQQAIAAVARSLLGLPAGSSVRQRLERSEAWREAGRAIAREFPTAILKDAHQLTGSICQHTASAADASAMTHGMTLELSHQRVEIIPWDFHQKDLGDEQNAAVRMGGFLTMRLESNSDHNVQVRDLTMEQALLLLSSLRYHKDVADDEIDRLAELIRSRKDADAEVFQMMDQLVPLPGAFAASQVQREALKVCDDEEALEILLGRVLSTYWADPSAHLFSTVADILVRGPQSRGTDKACGGDGKSTGFATAGGLEAGDINEQDVLALRVLDPFKAFEQTLKFYDLYHEHSLHYLLKKAHTWANPVDGSVSPDLRLLLERHARVLREELAELEQRPYIREALKPFEGDKAKPRQALRDRIQYLLSLIEAALQPPQAPTSTTLSTSMSTSGPAPAR